MNKIFLSFSFIIIFLFNLVLGFHQSIANSSTDHNLLSGYKKVSSIVRYQVAFKNQKGPKDQCTFDQQGVCWYLDTHEIITHHHPQIKMNQKKIISVYLEKKTLQEKMAKLTNAHIGDHMAMVVDGKIYWVLEIKDKIFGPFIQLSFKDGQNLLPPQWNTH